MRSYPSKWPGIGSGCAVFAMSWVWRFLTFLWTTVHPYFTSVHSGLVKQKDSVTRIREWFASCDKNVKHFRIELDMCLQYMLLFFTGQVDKGVKGRHLLQSSSSMHVLNASASMFSLSFSCAVQEASATDFLGWTPVHSAAYHGRLGSLSVSLIRPPGGWNDMQH